MKKIHILPTDKPSRLHKYSFEGFALSKETLNWKEAYHIYITSDEEIKEGVDQWYLDKVLNEPYNSGGAQYSHKQDVIIMTTDQDLIADGVQAINDEFLEWFVKNPSCEEVEVTKEDWMLNPDKEFFYKIIITKEEPEQEVPGKDTADYIDGYVVEKLVKLAKQEILEEVAEMYSKTIPMSIKFQVFESSIYKNAFITGAKWQMERSYSEEDMLKSFMAGIKCESNSGKNFEQFIEQFKKK